MKTLTVLTSVLLIAGVPAWAGAQAKDNDKQPGSSYAQESMPARPEAPSRHGLEQPGDVGYTADKQAAANTRTGRVVRVDEETLVLNVNGVEQSFELGGDLTATKFQVGERVTVSVREELLGSDMVATNLVVAKQTPSESGRESGQLPATASPLPLLLFGGAGSLALSGLLRRMRRQG